MKLQDGTAEFRVRDKNEDRVPTGIVQFFAGSSAPKGWLVCDGSPVSRTEYEELFAVIGTTYGAGDGSTTFNLPNLIDRFVEGGKSVGTKKSAGLPNITGTFHMDRLGIYANAGGTSAFKYKFTSFKDGTSNAYDFSSKAGQEGSSTFSFNASLSNPIYGSSDTVQPPSLVLLPIIKY